MSEAAAYWQSRYERDGRIWGDGPSELAVLAVACLHPLAAPSLRVLDVGCGYGRDAVHLARELGCAVRGLDPSPAAVTAARATAPRDLDLAFETGTAAGLASALDAAGDPGFDVVFTSNVYHLLRPAAREEFAAAVRRLTRPGGLLFLSTLADGDPQHDGKGEPVPGEERSWHEHVYLHFCTAPELRADFAAFAVERLEAAEYDEPNPAGLHRHRSWFLVARLPECQGEGTILCTDPSSDTT
jgi:SAM-dependent methyltransferase